MNEVKERRNSMIDSAETCTKSKVALKPLRRARSSSEIMGKRSRLMLYHHSRKDMKSNKKLSQVLAAKSKIIVNARNTNQINDDCSVNDQTIQTTASDDTYQTENTSYAYGKYASQRTLSRIDSSRKMYEAQCEFKKRIRAVPMRRASVKHSPNESVSCIDERTGTGCDDHNSSVSVKLVHSLNNMANGFISDSEEREDLTIVSKSSKDHCRKAFISCHVKTELKSSNISNDQNDESIIDPSVICSNISPTTVSDSSTADESKNDYPRQSLEDTSSLSNTEHTMEKGHSTLTNTSNEVNTLRFLLKEMRTSTKSLNDMGAKNRRGSNCTSTSRCNANRQKYHELEYDRRHSVSNYSNADAASIHFNTNDDDSSLSSKSIIFYRAESSNRLRAIPARRIERIGAKNRRESNCTSTSRCNANRQKYHELEYDRRHSVSNYSNADAASIHFNTNDDDNSLSSKSIISYRTESSNRLRAVPARRIERIRSTLLSVPLSSCLQKELAHSSIEPNEIPFSDIANQYLF